MESTELKEIINTTYDDIQNNPDSIKEESIKSAIERTIHLLDTGKVRVASPPEKAGDNWSVNTWVKKAILLYFRIREMNIMNAGEMEYWDKIPVKKSYDTHKVRVVPPGVARYGSYLEPGAVMMPSYVNIGAYVSSGTMVDTWATVGSCAQIGKNVHLSGGVGIGGVLEPPQADPVIIEDNAFLGSRSIVVEGVHIKKGVVLGAGVVLTSSTKIIDVSKKDPVVIKGYVPENSVVIPGSIPKEFPAGSYNVPAALIIGQRKATTDEKTSLNDALRDFEVSV